MAASYDVCREVVRILLEEVGQAKALALVTRLARVDGGQSYNETLRRCQQYLNPVRKSRFHDDVPLGHVGSALVGAKHGRKSS